MNKKTGKGKKLEEMSASELRSKAKTLGINLPKSLKSKDEIYAHLSAKMAEPKSGQPEIAPEPVTESEPIAGTDAKDESKNESGVAESESVTEPIAGTDPSFEPVVIEPEPIAGTDAKDENESGVAESESVTEPIAEPATEPIAGTDDPVTDPSAGIAAPPPIAPAAVFNIASTLREEIKKVSGVSPEELWRQTMGADGIMEQLEAYRKSLPANNLAEYDELLKLIRKDITVKLNGYNPEGTTEKPLNEPLSEIAPPSPVSPVQPAKSVQEILEEKFENFVSFLTKFKQERVCHIQHVNDFCKNNSLDGFELTYDNQNSMLKCSYFGAKAEREFKL